MLNKIWTVLGPLLERRSLLMSIITISTVEPARHDFVHDTTKHSQLLNTV